MVLAASIFQEDDDIRLALVIGYATREAKAKSLGGSLVRMTKTFSPDTLLGKAIGRGIYSYLYLVRVYYPNNERLVMDAKVVFSDRISW